jgi:hypothetical protein
MAFTKKNIVKRRVRHGGATTYFWHFILMISGAVTSLIIFLLKWGNILTF